MSPFAIFATVLTVAYVIYYAFIITKDLYGFKDQPKNDAETFDVSNLADEDGPIEVSEHPDDFSSRDDENYTEVLSDDGLHIYEPNGHAQEQEEVPVEEKKEKLTSEQLNQEYTEELEDIDVESSFSLDSNEFKDYLNQKHIDNKRKITKEHVIDNL